MYSWVRLHGHSAQSKLYLISLKVSLCTQQGGVNICHRSGWGTQHAAVCSALHMTFPQSWHINFSVTTSWQPINLYFHPNLICLHGEASLMGTLQTVGCNRPHLMYVHGVGWALVSTQSRIVRISVYACLCLVGVLCTGCSRPYLIFPDVVLCAALYSRPCILF